MALLRNFALCALLSAGAPLGAPLGSECALQEAFAEADEAVSLLQRRVALGAHLGAEVAVDARLERLTKASDPSNGCRTTLLTTFFITREDPQRHWFVKPSAGYFRDFYRSVLSVPGGGVRAVVLCDALPDSITQEYSTANGTFSFVKVDLSQFEPKLGLNDLRFQLFEDHLRRNPDLGTVFMTDIRDVVVLHNPCALVERFPDRLFVGSQADDLKADTCLGRHFAEMGGKYLEWYERVQPGHFDVLSPGIIGGTRSVLLSFLPKYNAAMMDPSLVMRQAGKHRYPKCRHGGRGATVAAKRSLELVRSNMPALNYVARSEYSLGQLVTGQPLHSVFRAWENRTDVYFRHK